MGRSLRLGGLGGWTVRLWAVGVVLLAGFGTWLALGRVAGAAPLRSLLPRVGAVSSAGRWGRAVEVPGTEKLYVYGYAWVTSVSCASAGSCSAGGYYGGGSRYYHPFVVDEVNGRWGSAEEVRGGATLNAHGNAKLYSVSCGSAGNCAAGGIYYDRSGHHQAFVVDEVNGTWGRARDVAAGLNVGGRAKLTSVSCASAGNCAAGGIYYDGLGRHQAFVVDEVNGMWGSAKDVAAKLNVGGHAFVNSVSCASAGNCVAGGGYKDGSSHYQAFVVDEVNGTWGSAEEVPGTATLNANGGAKVFSVSCASAGNCAAGGVYYDGSGHHQAFVVDEVNGTWGSAQEVPGTATLNHGSAYVDSVSCASAGNCVAGGAYDDGSGHRQVFLVDEVSGSWGSAQEVPGTATLNVDGDAELYLVSCTSAGNCAAGGNYEISGDFHAFVVDEVNGTWGSAEQVPGTATHRPWLTSVSCAPAGYCAAGGGYWGHSGGSYHLEAFVVDHTPSPIVTGLSPSRGPASGGTVVTITGKNLLAPTAVHFGAKAARVHKVLSATKIQVISPQGTGTVAVTVSTAGGTSAKTATDRFRYVRA